jgi:hypothetical protein
MRSHVNSRNRLVLTIAAIAALAAALPRPAAAQERPAPVAELHAGALVFADDGFPRENFFGGAARLYVLPRVSVGPEIAYISGRNHSHLMLTGNVTFDVLSPSNGRPAPVTPFIVAGGGLFQTREQFPRGTFTSTDPAFTAGGGVRARLGHLVTVGGEVRVGWELHVRVNALVGIRLHK